jgi:hypothetical protein
MHEWLAAWLCLTEWGAWYAAVKDESWFDLVWSAGLSAIDTAVVTVVSRGVADA